VRIEHTSAPTWPAIRPGRFAETIRTTDPAGCRIALVGLPDDTGVRLNGGRSGAAQGPSALRAALASYGTTWDGRTGTALSTGVFDAGDVKPASGADERALFETHARVESVVQLLYGLGLVPVCVGGGHDLSLPALSALARHVQAPLSGLNLDAHLDVRRKVGSGMPFRWLIEEGRLDPCAFAEVGLGRFANDETDARWLIERGATLVLAEDVLDTGSAVGWLEQVLARAGAGFLSIDLDGLDASAVPGVSAPSPLGVSVRHAAELAERAGADSRVLQLDLMELCPPHDPSGRSARVAAHLFLSFVAGFGARPA
jgi:formiminoglutamase